MKKKTILATLAGSTMVIAQPVAAATRSSESIPERGVQSTAAAERIGSVDAESEAVRGAGKAWLIVLIALIIAALIAAATGSKSPG